MPDRLNDSYYRATAQWLGNAASARIMLWIATSLSLAAALRACLRH